MFLKQQIQKELDDKVQRSQEQLQAESEEKEKLAALLEQQRVHKQCYITHIFYYLNI